MHEDTINAEGMSMDCVRLSVFVCVGMPMINKHGDAPGHLKNNIKITEKHHLGRPTRHQ